MTTVTQGNNAAVAECCNTQGQNALAFTPNVDVLEETDRFLVIADLPGTRAEDIDVEYENGELSIHAKVAPRGPERHLLREYGVGDFRRSFQLGEAVDSSAISAEYHDGVLTLNLPKTAAVTPRKVTVVAGATD